MDGCTMLHSKLMPHVSFLSFTLPSQLMEETAPLLSQIFNRNNRGVPFTDTLTLSN